MNTDQLISMATNEANARKKNTPLIVDIGNLVKELQGVNWENLTIEQLEGYAGKLSGYMFSLSQHVTDANMEYNSMYVFRKIRGATLYFEVDAKSQKDREKMAEEVNQNNYYNELVANYYADVLTHLYKNCERMVMTIQSIMSNKRSERINSKNQI